MSLYKRKGSPFWQYSFTIDGVRFRGSTGCAGKAEAREVEARERYEAKARRKRSHPWRVRECLGAYWQEHARHTLSARGIQVRLSALSELLGADKLIADLTNADMLDYRAARVAEGLEPHGVNRDFSYLQAALQWAHTMHGKDTPALAWKQIRLKEPPHRTRYLTRDEYARLLEECPANVALIVKFAVATGLRKSNILTLNWQQVDLDTGVVRVMLKGNRPHTVRLPPALRGALSTLPNRQGRVFDTTGFRKRFDKAVKQAGIEDFRFHDLRHTCATWMRMAGVDLIDIKDALGHTSIATTMRYAHVEPEVHVNPFDRISERVWSQNASQSGGRARNA